VLASESKFWVKGVFTAVINAGVVWDNAVKQKRGVMNSSENNFFMLIKLGNQRYLANSEKKANPIKIQLTF